MFCWKKSKINDIKRRLLILERPYLFNIGDRVLYHGNEGIVVDKNYKITSDLESKSNYYLVYSDKTKQSCRVNEYSLMKLPDEKTKKKT